MPELNSSLLSLHFRFSSGTGQLKVKSSHPVVAAFRRGIEEGQLTGNWRFLLATSDRSLEPIVVGTFVETPNKRLLYFPGADIEVSTELENTRFESHRLDHLTLDPLKGDDYHSHIAVRGLPAKQSRGVDYRAPVSQGFLFPWFSLLVSNLGGFAPLPAHLYVEFPAPRSDLQRYGEQLMANGGMIRVPLPPNPPDPHYVQFDVWVGHSADWRTRRAQPLTWAYKPEIVSDAPRGKQDIHIRTVNTDFGAESGISVISSQPQGRLTAPRILRLRFNPLGAA